MRRLGGWLNLVRRLNQFADRYFSKMGAGRPKYKGCGVASVHKAILKSSRNAPQE